MDYRGTFYLALTIFLGVIILIFGEGCTTHSRATGHHSTLDDHKHKTKPLPKVGPGKCVNLGRYSSNKVAVSVDKGCLKKGLTTVTLVLYSKKQGKAALLEGEKMMLALLGYKPRLVRITQMTDKGMYVFLSAVVGVLP